MFNDLELFIGVDDSVIFGDDTIIFWIDSKATPIGDDYALTFDLVLQVDKYDDYEQVYIAGPYNEIKDSEYYKEEAIFRLNDWLDGKVDI